MYSSLSPSLSSHFMCARSKTFAASSGNAPFSISLLTSGIRRLERKIVPSTSNTATLRRCFGTSTFCPFFFTILLIQHFKHFLYVCELVRWKIRDPYMLVLELSITRSDNEPFLNKFLYNFVRSCGRFRDDDRF